MQYLIDQSQSVGGKSQWAGPRDNRGLALSPDRRFLYAGYNNPSSGDNPFQVRKIDTTIADYTDATVAILTGYRGKAIATDDVGRVYLAEGTKVAIFDAGLTTSLYEITGLTATEGVAVTRENGALVLYTSDRTVKTLTRWVLTEAAGGVSAATKTGLGGSGVLGLSAAPASNPRGVAIDLAGRIWVADLGDNKVFRVRADGTALTSVAVAKAMAIAFDGTQALVTQSTNRTIAVLDQETMAAVPGSPLTPPWAALALDPDGQSGGGALSGIAMGDGAFVYVSNEAGQTAGETSTYGRVDAESSPPGSDPFYTDASHDDNDPILVLVGPDRSPPTVVCGSADLAWHATNVTVSCQASDERSGLAVPADASFTLSTSVAPGTENPNAATASRVVCDAAGHCATAGPVAGHKVDRKAPDIQVASPAPDAVYVVKEAVGARYVCIDGGSGVAHCDGVLGDGRLIDTSRKGAFAFVVTATDNAGNTTQVSVPYTVVATLPDRVQPADLVLDVAAPGKVARGVSYSYTITVTNRGPRDATDVRAVSPVPAGTTFVSAIVSQGRRPPRRSAARGRRWPPSG